jgi:hypothetical protein
MLTRYKISLNQEFFSCLLRAPSTVQHCSWYDIDIHCLLSFFFAQSKFKIFSSLFIAGAAAARPTVLVTEIMFIVADARRTLMFGTFQDTIKEHIKAKKNKSIFKSILFFL